MNKKPKDDPIFTAAVNAACVIVTIYELLDKVEKAGGTSSISGVAACHALITTMRKNKAEIDKSILKPLKAAIEAREARKHAAGLNADKSQ